jgi:LacI family transcriptional regulator
MLILQSADEVSSEQDSIKLCRQNRVAGLFACITSGTTDISSYQRLQGADVPVIFFDKVPDDETVVKVCMADAASAIIAANTIIEKKKKKVLALFGNSNLSITKKREAAFTKTIGDQTGVIIQHVNSTEEARLAEPCLIYKKPDTVFCMSDEILAGAMKAIQQSALKVPGGYCCDRHQQWLHS